MSPSRRPRPSPLQHQELQGEAPKQGHLLLRVLRMAQDMVDLCSSHHWARRTCLARSHQGCALPAGTGHPGQTAVSVDELAQHRLQLLGEVVPKAPLEGAMPTRGVTEDLSQVREHRNCSASWVLGLARSLVLARQTLAARYPRPLPARFAATLATHTVADRVGKGRAAALPVCARTLHSRVSCKVARHNSWTTVVSLERPRSLLVKIHAYTRATCAR